MKPDAPAEIRGEFRPIVSTIPGVDVCEHLPLTAQQMHHLCLVRSVHHEIVDYNAGAYYAATIYHALGIDPQATIIDPLGRPHHLALGSPILDIFA